MNRSIFLVVLSLLVITTHASTLKNGTYAHKKRIEQVWKSVKKIKNYPVLLCRAMDCKEGKASVDSKEWDFNAAVINEWERLGILKNGILDSETQEIIITTYFGDRPAVWGVEASKKIALASPWIYPRSSWVDNIPGHGLIEKIRIIKHILLM